MKGLNFFPNSPSLLSRVSKTIFSLALTLFFVFSSLTLFITYSLEDAVFNERLKQAHQLLLANKPLPETIKLVQNLSAFGLTSSDQLKYFEFDSDGGSSEFSFDGRHYHFMATEQGVLLLDTSELALVSRAIDDILLILLFALVPMLFITGWIARRISKYALKPFNQLSDAFLSQSDSLSEIKVALHQVEEKDIKAIAKQLVEALEQKANLLENQITFNQGMAHELRTPLQVMTHSLELLTQIDQKASERPSFKRLKKSVRRMQRISNGLLWLTSQKLSNHQTSVLSTVQDVVNEMDDLLTAHNIEVNIEEKAILEIPLPVDVFELMVFNLLTNVIHHSEETTELKYWNIRIESSAIYFSNPVASNASEMADNERFGLGLILIEKLADKFSLKFSTTQQQQEFVASLSL